MHRPHEDFTTGDVITATIPAIGVTALLYYLLDGFGYDVHILIYAGIWLFAYILFSAAIMFGKKIGAAQDAQIEINERQKKQPAETPEDDQPGIHYIDEDLYDEPDSSVVSPERKERGDLPKAPPPSNNWPP